MLWSRTPFQIEKQMWTTEKGENKVIHNKKSFTKHQHSTIPVNNSWDVCVGMCAARWMGADATLHWVFLKRRTGSWEETCGLNQSPLTLSQQDHRGNKQREIGLNGLLSFAFSFAYEVFASSFRFFHYSNEWQSGVMWWTDHLADL